MRIVCGPTNGCAFIGGALGELGHEIIDTGDNATNFWARVSELAQFEGQALVVADEDTLPVCDHDEMDRAGEVIDRGMAVLETRAMTEKEDRAYMRVIRHANDICDGKVKLLRLQRSIKFLRNMVGKGDVKIVVLLLEEGEEKPLPEAKYGASGADLLIYGIEGDWSKKLLELIG